MPATLSGFSVKSSLHKCVAWQKLFIANPVFHQQHSILAPALHLHTQTRLKVGYKEALPRSTPTPTPHGPQMGTIQFMMRRCPQARLTI